MPGSSVAWVKRSPRKATPGAIARETQLESLVILVTYWCVLRRVAGWVAGGCWDDEITSDEMDHSRKFPAFGQKIGYIDGYEMAYPVLPSCYHFLKMLSDSRIKYLGHILRHPDSEESIFMFNPFN
jgi:hypothetical protein